MNHSLGICKVLERDREFHGRIQPTVFFLGGGGGARAQNNGDRRVGVKSDVEFGDRYY